MTVLPDTSVWVEYLRKGQRGDAWPLDGLLESGSVVVCGPIAAELLAGTRENDRSDLWSALYALPWAPLGSGEWRQVGNVAGALRERGSMVALTDVEIAVAAVNFGAQLWTRDSDFARVAEVLVDLKFYRTDSVLRQG